MNRRTFIQSSAIAMASGMTARGANDRINVAVIGVRGRGRDHITSYSKIPDARRGGLRHRSGADRARRAVHREDHGRQAAEDLSGHPQAVRRQRHRRRLHRHAQPLARAGHHLGLPGRQGRLRREARQPQHLGRPQDGGGRAQVQPHGAGRLAEPHHRITKSAPCSCCTMA